MACIVRVTIYGDFLRSTGIIMRVLHVLCVAFCLSAIPGQADDSAQTPLSAQLEKAGGNKPELQTALDRAPVTEREGMEFLIENMPERDLKSLKADYLLENNRLAYVAWREAPWSEKIPKEVFLNDILPYASINEKRDDWRKDFYERFSPLVKDAKSPSQAATILNQKVFSILNVKYSTARKKADQSPLESMESGLASCSGLSVILIDACRAVGVPARFVGTPRWSDNSGNHSWVEIWDNGWHFTGACEPAGDKLNDAWFIGRAAGAKRDDRTYAIYASSFRRTPQHFPLVWDRRNEDVPSVNVTDRYTNLGKPISEGHKQIYFRVTAGERKRVRAELILLDAAGKEVWKGLSNDERFDANDHAGTPLKAGEKYRIEAKLGEDSEGVDFEVTNDSANVIDIRLPPVG
jgi:hypothetical protein